VFFKLKEILESLKLSNFLYILFFSFLTLSQNVLRLHFLQDDVYFNYVAFFKTRYFMLDENLKTYVLIYTPLFRFCEHVENLQFISSFYVNKNWIKLKNVCDWIY